MDTMSNRDGWFDLARKVDWTFRYVREADVYPPLVSGSPWLPHSAWAQWEEPYRTTYTEYVEGQSAKEASVDAVRESVGSIEDFTRLDPAWRSAIKLHAATLALAEFAAVIGNLRAARFGRDSAWRNAALLGALDETRHAQIPLLLMHDLVRADPQLDWIHRFFHTDNWLAIAARHLVDELLILADPIEFAVATNFVFETGFTNLQFIGLSSLAHAAGDKLFEKLLGSIQTDEARHAQMGPAVLEVIVRHDRARAQQLVDKWFWRSWLFFSLVTGFCMDYLTPLPHRTQSFKEFVEEWVLDQFEQSLAAHGLERPWYWPQFLESISTYHHKAYASAYTYRATTWFDFPVPGPAERKWLREKYFPTWDSFAPIWDVIGDRWRKSGPGVEWYTHGTTPIGFCNLCQLVLCNGPADANAARVIEFDGSRYIFCSEPCERIFRAEPERYRDHEGVVKRILGGEAPANLLELVRTYFGLPEAMQGKDSARGRYEWLGSESRTERGRQT
jgi:toluene monooxygenase system protein A